MEITMARICVIDDQSDVRAFIRLALETADMEVVEAEDGNEALGLLTKDANFDLILLDIRMPGLDGITFKSKLNDVSRLKEIPVLFVSSLKDDHFKMAGRYMGAVDYIQKPFEPDLLIAKVHDLLAQHTG
jgi:DNA-binding response OmpR family regulator